MAEQANLGPANGASAPSDPLALDADPPTHLEAFNRLSLHYADRILLGSLVTGLAGMSLGLMHGAQEAELRFRAEHAHRLPTSQVGWYLYHKSKNYNTMLAAGKEAARMASRTVFWTIVFFGMEEGVDCARAAAGRAWRDAVRGRDAWIDDDRLLSRNRDFLSSMFAGLGTGGAFSLWNRFPAQTTVRAAKVGAKAGLAFGIAQDVISMLRGRKLGYIEFIKRLTIGTTESSSDLRGSPGTASTYG